MSYFLFLKSSNNTSTDLCRIAENKFDLDNLNIIKDDYKIIEENNKQNFDDYKYCIKEVVDHVGDIINYEEYRKYTKKGNPSEVQFFQDYTEKNGTLVSGKEKLKKYIVDYSDRIKNFLNLNPNHALFDRWNDYLNQMNSLDLDSVPFPLVMSLEKYFNDLGKPSYHPLQLP